MNKLKQKLKHKKSASDVISNPVFGGYIPDEIHPIVTKGIEYMSLPENLETEGLFRISGDITHLNHLKEEFNKGKYDDPDKINMHELSKGNVHNTASLLKMYFREMAEPLLTFDHYDMFIAAHGVPEKETRLVVIKKVLKFLPRKNMQLLKMLCHFLNTIASFSHLNKMVSPNLAIVFAPNLLRPRGAELSLLMSDSPHANGLMTTLIDEYEYMFVNGEDEEQPEQNSKSNHHERTESVDSGSGSDDIGSASGLALRTNRKQLPIVPQKQAETKSTETTSSLSHAEPSSPTHHSQPEPTVVKPKPPPKMSVINRMQPPPSALIQAIEAQQQQQQQQQPSTNKIVKPIKSDNTVTVTGPVKRIPALPPKSGIVEEQRKKFSAPNQSPSAFYSGVDSKLSHANNNTHNLTPIQTRNPPKLPVKTAAFQKRLSDATASPTNVTKPDIPPRRQ